VSDQPISPASRPDGPGGQRHASVTLRQDGAAGDQGPQLDPANQSLAEALNLVFRLLQVAMLGLFVYFALSGFQSIKENEKGLRLIFGRKAGADLPPGFQFSYPYPVGELVRVDVGEQRMEIVDSFWPALSADQRKMGLGQLAQSSSWYGIRPERDGSLITGDQNLAHTQWQVRYMRSDAGNWVENVLDAESEQNLVRSAVERGVLQAVAHTRIEDLLKQSAGDEGSIAYRAQEIAQQTLDGVNSGLRIVQLTLKERTAPLAVYNDFSRVQSADQEASKARDAADSAARDTLNKTAGEAHRHLIAQIDEYEKAVTLGDRARQELVLDVIRKLLEGEPVTISGEVVQGLSAGRVRDLINSARSYRTAVVTQARSDLETYKTKLVQYRMNPRVVVQGDWADAMSALLSRDIVEIIWAPPATSQFVMWLNRDPQHQKDFDEAQKRAKLRAEEEQRLREFNEARFKTNTDVQVMPGG
jgi:regulator of protease activity HflC (stomatin/prohibitin superfamily)